MSKGEYGGICTAAIGSMTAAIRAQRILATAAIHVNVVKNESSAKNSGCLYSLAFPCGQSNNVRSVLRAAHIGARYESN
jgi:hypothetical protein